MRPRLVACTKCRAAVPPALYNALEPSRCPSCGAGLQIAVFPAALRPPAPGAMAEAVVVDGEAGCFYHPAKRAVVPCDSCGRFLCAVCDVEIGSEHLCPGCIESGKKEGRMRKLETRRTLYDDLALTLTLYLFWASFVTAPIALYIAVRHWNAPSSIVRPTRWRMKLAVVLALLEIVWWGGGILLSTLR